MSFCPFSKKKKRIPINQSINHQSQPLCFLEGERKKLHKVRLISTGTKTGKFLLSTLRFSSSSYTQSRVEEGREGRLQKMIQKYSEGARKTLLVHPSIEARYGAPTTNPQISKSRNKTKMLSLLCYVSTGGQALLICPSGMRLMEQPCWKQLLPH